MAGWWPSPLPAVFIAGRTGRHRTGFCLPVGRAGAGGCVRPGVHRQPHPRAARAVRRTRKDAEDHAQRRRAIGRHTGSGKDRHPRAPRQAPARPTRKKRNGSRPPDRRRAASPDATAPVEPGLRPMHPQPSVPACLLARQAATRQPGRHGARTAPAAPDKARRRLCGPRLPRPVAGAGAGQGQAKNCPPFALITEPVMKPASFETRKATQRAISSGSPRRPTGIWGMIRSARTFSSMARTMSVPI